MLRISLLGPWVHVPGALVVERARIGAVRGEAVSLGRLYGDRRLRRARYMERFVLHEGGRKALAAPRWRHRLADKFLYAGRGLAKRGQRADALACFRRAVAYAPWHLVALVWLVRTALAPR